MAGEVWVVIQLFGGCVDTVSVYDTEEKADAHYKEFFKEVGVDVKDERQLERFREHDNRARDCHVHKREVR